MRPTNRTCLSLVLTASSAAAVVAAQEPPAPAPPPADEITLEKIMADPEWIGNAPLMSYWADEGSRRQERGSARAGLLASFRGRSRMRRCPG